MIEVERRIIIERTPSQVFSHLSRPETYAAWLPGVRSVTIDAAGPVGPGTPVTLEFVGPGGTISASGQVTELEPDRRVALEAAAAPLRFTAAIDIALVDGAASTSDSTELALAVRLELLGGMAFLEGLARAQAIGEVGKALDRLKVAVETEAPPV